MMQQSNENGPTGGPDDLQFTTSIDETIPQNVPLPPPPPPPTNNVLSDMMQASSNKSYASGSNYTPPSSSSGAIGNASGGYTPSLPGILSYFHRSAHPTACLFHILFKALAFTLYILGKKFGLEDVMVTVLCILLSAADFWVVKNITGRLLVGLRWWNKVDPVTGRTSWIFESAAPTSPAGGGSVGGGYSATSSNSGSTNTFDSKFFWTILYLTPVLWSLAFMSAILWFEFQCFVTLSCALVLSFSNVYGYYKCSADQREKWKQWMDTGAEMGVRAMIRNGMFGMLFNRGGGGRGQMQPVPQNDGTFA